MLALIFVLLAQQAPCPHPPAAGDTAALALTYVERRPAPDAANAPPPYPSLLRQAGVGGAVGVAFVVDTVGIPEGASIKVLRSPNPGFDLAVKRTVSRWRFTPAVACGLRARVRLTHEFAFIPGTRDSLASLFDVDTSVTVSRDTTPDGTPRMTLRWRSTAVIITAVPWDSAQGDSAEEAVLAVLIAGVPPAKDSMAQVVCLFGPPQKSDTDPDRGRLSRLTRTRVTVLSARRCPPTYVSMMRAPDQRPDPPGEDPYHIWILSRRAIATDRALFDADVAQGAGGTRHRCGAERRDKVWVARCLSLFYWVS